MIQAFFGNIQQSTATAIYIIFNNLFNTGLLKKDLVPFKNVCEIRGNKTWQLKQFVCLPVLDIDVNA